MRRTLDAGCIERDLPRGAPPVKVDIARLVELTTQSTPEAATRWSTRTMAAELGVSAASVSRHWRANGVKPHVVRGFKVSRDPKFARLSPRGERHLQISQEEIANLSGVLRQRGNRALKGLHVEGATRCRGTSSTGV